ncbi:MAG TPA: MBOAT family protein [Tepidisphaeraceae bacterium]|nr:MBOAT family protein [Tepidisphaeraceae bacterium]
MNFSNFTAPTFLFLFLPVVLGAYFITPRSLRNFVLLVASLLFYAEGERVYTLVMLFSIGFNYGMGLWLGRSTNRFARHGLLVCGVMVNLALLGTYKYATFVTANLNAVLAIVHVKPLPVPHLHLPIGISFFTFHALSYLTDVYRREVRAMRRFDSFALYITLFPQLIAGPIIRYKIIAHQFSDRVVTLEGFAEGIRRFVIGMGKKLLIADTVAFVADQIFNHAQAAQLTPSVAWLGVLCYTIQIYFDFSGYSDMAIGLGRMFGFVFPENFNYPYISASITDFWRRWHMTLSSWFRDYLYIPMGGNRCRPARVYFNLLTVFFLCGLWHGPTWNFVVWGLIHGAFLIIERVGLTRWMEKWPAAFRHLYVLTVVMVGWVFFNSKDLPQSMTYLSVMFGLRHGNPAQYPIGLYLNNAVILALAAGMIGSMPFIPAVRRLWEKLAAAAAESGNVLPELLGRGASVALLALIYVGCTMMSAHGSYSPFIYYRF